MRYNIEHTDSNAIRAIADSAGGSVISDVAPVTDTGHSIAVVDFPYENEEYMDEMLNESDAVVSFR